MIVQMRPIGSIRPYENNPRNNDAAVEAVVRSIREYGWRQPIVVDSDGIIIVGHTRHKAAMAMGLQEVPVHVAADLPPEKARAYRIADNRVGELAEWEPQALSSELAALEALGVEMDALGWEPDELREAMGKDTEIVEDEPPAPLPDPVSKTGDLWILGEHRLLCGDSTNVAEVARLIDGTAVDCVLTDPPYCSGGFQEAGRGAGSVGTNGEHRIIANDRLSTRGFMALLKSVLGNVPSKYIYCFTDWRMWVHLFDIAESCGYCVRSMIVWDKGTPGMGRGWRCQHELILWGCRETAPFDKHASGQGNVITAPRTGNTLHTTEKPVSLVSLLLTNAPFIKTVYDPFSGSGTTLIAAEQSGRKCYGVELDPLYVDVIIRRWQNLTGQQATLESTGKTWAAVAKKRGVKIDEPESGTAPNG